MVGRRLALRIPLDRRLAPSMLIREGLSALVSRRLGLGVLVGWRQTLGGVVLVNGGPARCCLVDGGDVLVRRRRSGGLVGRGRRDRLVVAATLRWLGSVNRILRLPVVDGRSTGVLRGLWRPERFARRGCVPGGLGPLCGSGLAGGGVFSGLFASGRRRRIPVPDRSLLRTLHGLRVLRAGTACILRTLRRLRVVRTSRVTRVVRTLLRGT